MNYCDLTKRAFPRIFSRKGSLLILYNNRCVDYPTLVRFPPLRSYNYTKRRLMHLSKSMEYLYKLSVGALTGVAEAALMESFIIYTLVITYLLFISILNPINSAHASFSSSIKNRIGFSSGIITSVVSSLARSA